MHWENVINYKQNFLPTLKGRREIKQFYYCISTKNISSVHCKHSAKEIAEVGRISPFRTIKQIQPVAYLFPRQITHGQVRGLDSTIYHAQLILSSPGGWGRQLCLFISCSQRKNKFVISSWREVGLELGNELSLRLSSYPHTFWERRAVFTL